MGVAKKKRAGIRKKKPQVPVTRLKLSNYQQQQQQKKLIESGELLPKSATTSTTYL